MVTKTRMSVAEYLALPEDEGPYFEYIDGEAVQKPMPDFRHGILAGEVLIDLGLFRRAQGMGAVGPEIRARFADPDAREGRQYRLPDISYWAPGRQARGDEATTPPTLAIEVRSPDQSRAEQRARARYFRTHGCDACWLIDPDLRTVEVFEGDTDGAVLREGDVLRTPLLPGFELDIAALFAVMDAAE